MVGGSCGDQNRNCHLLKEERTATASGQGGDHQEMRWDTAWLPVLRQLGRGTQRVPLKLDEWTSHYMEIEAQRESRNAKKNR